MHPDWSSPVPMLRHLMLSHNRLSNVVDAVTMLAPISDLETLDLSRQVCEKADEPMDSASNTDVVVTRRRAGERSAVDEDGEPLQTSDVDEESLGCSTHTSSRLKCSPPPPSSTSEMPTRRKRKIDALCLSMPNNLKELLLARSLKLNDRMLLPIVVEKGGRNLTYLRFSENSIQNVDGPLLFREPVENLTIDFSNNQITCLATGYFNESTRTGSRAVGLRLVNNRLSTQIGSDNGGQLFRDYVHLEVLDLRKNGIKQLHRNAFHNLVLLKQLVLAENSLRAIDFEFRHMKRLELLDLSDNLLVVLDQVVVFCYRNSYL